MNKITKETGGFIWEVIFFCILAILLLFLTFRGFSLPFYWDTGAFLIPAAESIAKTGNLLSYVQDTDYPHFFLLPWVLSFFINLPNHIVIIHVFSYFMSVFFLIVMYYLGKIIANRTIGAALALTFLTNPLFLAQTNLVYFEIIGAAFRYLAIILLLKKKYFFFTLISLMSLVREYNALVMFCIGLVYMTFNQEIKSKWKWFASFLLPIIFASYLWLIIHYQEAGWWFYSPLRFYTEKRFETLIQALAYLLMAQGRWIYMITIIMSALFIFFHYKEKIKYPFPFNSYRYLTIFILTFSVLGTLGSMTILGYLLYRHIFPVLPVLYLTTFILIFKALSTKRILFLTVLLILTLVQFLYRFDCHAGNFEDCYTVYDLLETKKKASRFLESYAFHKKIGVSFPEDSELTQPILGYVNQPLFIEQISKKMLKLPDLIYIAPSSDNILLDFVDKNNYSLIKFFPLSHTGNNFSVYAKNSFKF